jgi:hypothetical protein
MCADGNEANNSSDSVIGLALERPNRLEQFPGRPLFFDGVDRDVELVGVFDTVHVLDETGRVIVPFERVGGAITLVGDVLLFPLLELVERVSDDVVAELDEWRSLAVEVPFLELVTGDVKAALDFGGSEVSSHVKGGRNRSLELSRFGWWG